MGKRSNFDRKDKDFYVTPIEAVRPLIPHIPLSLDFIDPCCGDGAIGKAFSELILQQLRVDCDLFDYGGNILADATTTKYNLSAEFFITNPPWDRTKKNGEILHKIIDNLAGQKPTWLLFDSDWMFTKQSASYMAYCVKVVAVGRVKWFPDTKQTGKDNVCWYLFDKNHTGSTEFIGRQ